MKLMDVVVHSSITPEPSVGRDRGMGMGKPVVATRRGPIDIVIDGETGFLVKMGDSKEMAEKLITLLKDESCLQKWEKGRARFESIFSKERYARQAERVYADVVKCIRQQEDSGKCQGIHSRQDKKKS